MRAHQHAFLPEMFKDFEQLSAQRIDVRFYFFHLLLVYIHANAVVLLSSRSVRCALNEKRFSLFIGHNMRYDEGK